MTQPFHATRVIRPSSHALRAFFLRCQQRSDTTADERGHEQAASVDLVSDAERGTRDVGMGDNSSRKHGEANGDDGRRRRDGGGDTDNRDNAGIPRVDSIEDSNSNRVERLETGKWGTRGSITEESQHQKGSDGGGSSGYAVNAGLGAKGGLTGNFDDGDTMLTHGETQSADHAGPRNDASERAAAGDHERSPSSTLGIAYGSDANMRSTATAVPSEGVAVAGYGDGVGGVTPGDTDGVQGSPGYVASSNLTDSAQHAGAGETLYGEPGNTDTVPRERDGANNGTAPIDHGRRKTAGGYDDGAGGGARQGDAGRNQRNTALVSPERDGDGGGGQDDHRGSEHAPTAPAGFVEQESTTNRTTNDAIGVLDESIGVGAPSQTRRPTLDSGQNSDTSLEKKTGDTKYGGPSVVVDIGDGKSRPVQSEDGAETDDGGADGAVVGTSVENGDPGGRRKVSFDVGGLDASSSPARPSSSLPPQVSSGKLWECGVGQIYSSSVLCGVSSFVLVERPCSIGAVVFSFCVFCRMQ